MAESYKPTDGMASAARRALAWKEEGKAGGTLVGMARANQLKDREPLSASTVLRMHSFFSRHEVDKRATGFLSGEEGFPSAGRVAWDLWGGDGGQTWAGQKRDQIMRERESKAYKLVHVTTKSAYLPDYLLAVAAQAIEDYANQNIAESVEAFGQFMYHAQLLRNCHLDVYLIDLHMVAQPYRDVLIDVFVELDDYGDDMGDSDEYEE
jgi:hypothetical protein